MSTRVERGVRSAVFALASVASVGAHAAGFAIIEHSAQGMGNAFAGGGAVAEDASTMWFNPASMTRLPTQVLNAGHVIVASFEFTGSARSGAGANIIGNGSLDGGTVGLVPNIYYLNNITDTVTFGIGVNAPFGLATEYDRDWVGRYQAIESEIATINVNPSLAWKLTDRLSLGAGVSAQYFKAKLTSAVDFRSSCLGAAQRAQAGGQAQTAATLGAACQGASNTALDGFSETKAENVGFGWNVGMMYELSEHTRFSASFRSSIEHELDGDITFALPNNAVILGTFGNLFPADGVTADVELPASISLSAYHRFGEKFGVMANALWTQWSDIPNLTIVSDTAIPGRAQRSVEDLQWEDAWRLGLGLNYYHSSHLTLRTGLAYDQSPARGGSQLTTARLPDADRFWVAIGASYAFTDSLKADLGYAHLFVDDTSINRTGGQQDVLTGSYESDANIVSVQINYVF